MLTLLVAGFFLLSSCDKDENTDPEPDPTPKKEQVATFMRIDFTPTTGPVTPPILYPYIEVEYDNEKGTYSSSSKNLKISTEYTVSVNFKDKRVSPELNISDLIKSKAEEYQVFIKTDNPALQFEVLDKDSKNLPIGLELKATTGNEIKSVNMTTIIIHAPGTKNGTVTVGKEVFNTFKSVNIF